MVVGVGIYLCGCVVVSFMLVLGLAILAILAKMAILTILTTILTT